MEHYDRERTQALRDKDVLKAIEADDRFHAVLIEAARNPEIERLLQRVMPHIRRLDLLHFDALTRHEDTETGHAAILDALRRGDAQTAAHAAEANFLRLGEQMAAVLESEPG
jgi:DNA-binding GntR family transcriptional regulator